ncbi:uncharacterized protein LOC143238167 [Tachypleus tridentatus]|uniref:uncharacterized protein LOC143238167 n=1 Tax=Tachypleus tridentatus TaxID=6853 RepID=UPI003FD5DB1F
MVAKRLIFLVVALSALIPTGVLYPLVWLPRTSFVEENLCGADIDNATKIALLQCIIGTSPPWMEQTRRNCHNQTQDGASDEEYIELLCNDQQLSCDLEDCQLKIMDYEFKPWTKRTNRPLNPTRWAEQWPLRGRSRWNHHSQNRDKLSGARQSYRFHDMNRPWGWRQKQKTLPWQWQYSREIGQFAPRRLQTEHPSSWRRNNERLMTPNLWMSRHRRFKRHMGWFNWSPFSHHGPRMLERQRWKSWSICPFAGFNDFDLYNAWLCIHSAV